MVWERGVGAGRGGGDELRAVGERLELRDPEVLATGRGDERAGAAQQRAVLGGSDQANTAFLAKPFTGGALLEQVRRLAPLRHDTTR